MNCSAALWLAQTSTIGPVLVVLVGVLFLAERRWPAVRRPAVSRAHVVDAGYLVLAWAATPLVTLLNTGFGIAVGRYAGFLELQRLPLVPRLAVVAVTIVGID